VLVLGGYGTFGRRISAALAQDPLIDCVVVGRTLKKGAAFAQTVGARFLELDIDDNAALKMALAGAFALVHTCGPFQGRDYKVARACIDAGVHYVDLADARAFVCGIEALHDEAKREGVLVVSGASSVPAVSSALVDLLSDDFSVLEEIHSAISPGNKNPRGLATVRAILSYVGVPLRVWERGRWRKAIGWSEPERIEFNAPVGRRTVYWCDVPDLQLFPDHYRVHTVSFRAGMQLSLFNGGLSLLGKLKRRQWLQDLPRWAGVLVTLSHLFKLWGDSSGAIRVRVVGKKGRERIERFADLVARDAHGPAIPCSPSIALIKKMVNHSVPVTGAMPCMDLLTLEEITNELKGYDIVLVRG
jgi:hypothetical protein